MVASQIAFLPNLPLRNPWLAPPHENLARALDWVAARAADGEAVYVYYGALPAFALYRDRIDAAGAARRQRAPPAAGRRRWRRCGARCRDRERFFLVASHLWGDEKDVLVSGLASPGGGFRLVDQRVERGALRRAARAHRTHLTVAQAEPLAAARRAPRREVDGAAAGRIVERPPMHASILRTARRAWRALPSLLLLLVVALLWPRPALGQWLKPFKSDAYEANADLEKVAPALLAARQQLRAGQGLARTQQALPSLPMRAGVPEIDVRLTEVTPRIVAQLRAAGMVVSASYAEYARVVGTCDPLLLDRVAAIPEVRTVHPNYRPLLAVGEVTSQADTAIRATEARAALDVDGSGVPIGILSDSFNAFGGGVVTGGGCARTVTGTSSQGSADLPASVRLLQDLAGGTDEGRAMAELVHDLAPGAPLLFNTAFTSEAGFAAGIDALRACGAKVIVDDVIYFAEPMFQDGPIAQAAQAAVDAGVPYFSSAGNYGRVGVDEEYVDGAPGDPDNDFHLFGSGDQVASITLPQRLRRAPGAAVGRAVRRHARSGRVERLRHRAVRLQRRLVQRHSGRGRRRRAGLLDAGRRPGRRPARGPRVAAQLDGCAAHGVDGRQSRLRHDHALPHRRDAARQLLAHVVGLRVRPGGVRRRADLRPRRRRRRGRGGGGGLSRDRAGRRPAGAGERDQRRALQLARRPRAVLLHRQRRAAAGGVQLRSKPEIAAPDGTNTTFFLQDADGDGFPNFFGTSAAAPHAAAVAALIRERNPALSPSAVLDRLTSTAIDIEAPGYDFLSGFGLIDALDAVTAATPQGPTQATLENPQPGTFQSGIGLVSGWVCDADTVTYQIDGGALRDAAYGTSRADTLAVCGDTDNGFGALLNWNLLGDGAHTIRAFADGVEVAAATFEVATLGAAVPHRRHRRVRAVRLPRRRREHDDRLAGGVAELRDRREQRQQQRGAVAGRRAAGGGDRRAREPGPGRVAERHRA